MNPIQASQPAPLAAQSFAVSPEPALGEGLKPGPEKTRVEVFTSYGTDEKVIIRGRVLEGDLAKTARPEDSRFTNLIRNLGFLDSDEVKHAAVEIQFAGKTIQARTDRDGVFEVAVGGFVGLKPGYHDVQVSLVGDKDFLASSAHGKVVVQTRQDSSFGVVSDIDDTIHYSHASNKLKAARTLLLGNETTLKPVPGMAALYQALDLASDGLKDGDVSYLSGSPINFAGRIESYLQDQGFPRGSLQLKNMGFRKGEENPIQHSSYKLEHLRNLFETYPEKSFFLFGDSGEADPEVYAQITSEYPDRILGVFINQVTDEASNSKRFAGMSLIRSGLDAAQILYQQGVLSEEALEQVRRAVADAAR